MIDQLGLGCRRYGPAEPESAEQSAGVAIIREAYARGVCHYDSAQGYGDGRSELIVGEALSMLSDTVHKHLPKVGNIFKYNP